MRHAAPITVSTVDLPHLEQLLDELPEFGPIAEALDEELSRARVVPPEQIDSVVTMNSRVLCREADSGKEYQITLVYPRDAGEEGRVSVLAPAGSVLLGAHVGEILSWPVPGGKERRVELMSLETAVGRSDSHALSE
ncbi:nucleoside diphosphate kinase regulator [Pseudomonas oryzihabitans]|uniref:Regulator of nucleoside diphosphate kinase n=1 Tax=Pseudomonas oryzihabitans TaxID=47885 RepID=A0AAJ2BNN1_9PSED|nr:nucleoside diphosphate kinase regulator [Pseudomonas psychrotolerans]MDR6234681.1 regulator of nucleoside diphosphate kinase [Pseudomonas psychrotolerans]MDR6356163.1 regulator of nucleoside diphosphate kinase [Pseudomonas psychrotolerans]